MVLWVGLDDTDSLRGMCTTFLATEIVRVISLTHDLIGYPRLVRLNPNIPWKTRGNGALAMRFGHGKGRPRVVADIGGRAIRSYPQAAGHEDPEELREPLEALMERWSVFDDPTTNPAFAVLRKRPTPALYWQAVRGIVTRRAARRSIRGLGFSREYKNGRGIIGATAAVAWRPRDRTYEVLAYREPGSWGTQRRVDPGSVIQMDRAFPSTFNNYDYANRRVVIAPHSPCPVLCGIRGDDPDVLPEALETIRGEVPERWLVFETNQGTDDHVRWDDWSLRPYTTVSVDATVSAMSQTGPGGHVFIPIVGPKRIIAAAYEPSKQFRNVLRGLRPGDRIRAWGSVRTEPRTLNLEKLEVLWLARPFEKVGNPACPICGKSMKSRGREAGFRCVRGHARLPYTAASFREERRRIALGLVEPPASARRHLAKPIQRMGSSRSAISRPGALRQRVSLAAP